MDSGGQSGHVSNRKCIYNIDQSARSRLNIVYMFCYFIGGGLSSYLGAGRFDYVLKELRHDLERITRLFYNHFRKTIDRRWTG
jgi:hypothetical protein